jgi:hypothetical protein
MLVFMHDRGPNVQLASTQSPGGVRPAESKQRHSLIVVLLIVVWESHSTRAWPFRRMQSRVSLQVM